MGYRYMRITFHAYRWPYLLNQKRKVSSFSSALSLDHKYLQLGVHHGEKLLQSLCQDGQLERALELLSQIRKPIPRYLYISLLRFCSKSKIYAQTKLVHEHICQHNVPLTGFLGDDLVMSLAKCGAIEQASEVFASLPQHSVFSLTALISAHVENGSTDEALQIYVDMLSKGVEPNGYTFVCLLKSCGGTHNLEQGKLLNTSLVEKGLTSDLYIGSALVTMYGKCGAVEDAECIFCSQFPSDVKLWNGMMSVYIEVGCGEKALQLYRQMWEEGVQPDQLTLVLSLQSCPLLSESEIDFTYEQHSKEFSLEMVRALHSYARRMKPDIIVGNTLVTIYSKSRALIEAENVFASLPQRSVVSWNVMISAYVQQGEGEKALFLYRQMQVEGTRTEPRTILLALQACSQIADKEDSAVKEGQLIKIKCLEIGKALHTDARTKNFESDIFIATALLTMYGKCGALPEAEAVFAGLIHRDEVSWNALLSAYIEQGHIEKAFKLYRQMHAEGSSPHQLSSLLALQACVSLSEGDGNAIMMDKETCREIALEVGQALHSDGRRKGITYSSHFGSALVNLYGKLGDVQKAENVFYTHSECDVVLWSVMLAAYVEQGKSEMALQLYTQMHKEGVTADQHSLLFAIQACGILAEKEKTLDDELGTAHLVSFEIGRALHADVETKGFAANVFVGSALVSMYGKCGAFSNAEDVFYNMNHCSTASWNAILSVYLEQGQAEKALFQYSEIKKQNVICDDITLIAFLQACRMAGNLEICRKLHFDIVVNGNEQNLPVAASLIHAYGNCASTLDGQSLFDGINSADLVSCNACIDGHSGGGLVFSTMHAFENLVVSVLTPDEVTYTSLLTACSHTGYTFKALHFFESMVKDYDIQPTLKHYGILLDLLGRAGDFRRIESMLENMHLNLNLAMWLCLLGACSTHGNLELAKHAFEHAVQLQPNQSTAYILMSNIYIDHGLLECAVQIGKLRQNKVMLNLEH